MKIAMLLFSLFCFSPRVLSPNSDKEIEVVARQFVELVDVNNSSDLSSILDPNMMQHVSMGDQFFSSSAQDFIQMVSEKKVGGKPRRITIHETNVIRGAIAEVQLQATSSELDFMYQLSLVKTDGKWIIVGAVVDIVAV